MQRANIAGATLGLWLFVLVGGIAHACDGLEPSAAPAVAVAAGAPERHAGAPPGCEANVPVVGKLPPIDDQPDARLPIAAGGDVGAAVVFPPARRLARTAQPPTGVPPFLRYTHLRL